MIKNVNDPKLLIIFFFLITFNTQSQNDYLDTSFNVTGYNVIDINSQNNFANGMAIQPNQKSIVVGSVSNGTQDSVILYRFNNDGTLDTSFNSVGYTITGFQYTSVGKDVALQPDGKILVAGHTWNGNVNTVAVIRFNNNGTLDQTFANNGKFIMSSSNKNYLVNRIKLEDDGNLIVAGFVYESGEDQQDHFLARISEQGTLDAGFGNSGIVVTNFGADYQNWINDIHVLSNGKIVTTGFSGVFGLPFPMVVRYNSNGSVDTSFANNGYLSIAPQNNSLPSLFKSVTADSNNNLYFAGFTIGTSNYYSDSIIVKTDSNGNLDTSFGVNGIKTFQANPNQNDGLDVIKFHPSGALILGGSLRVDWSTIKIFVSSMDLSGNINTNYGNNGVVTFEGVTTPNILKDMEIQNVDKVLLVGDVGNDILLTRFTQSPLGIEEFSKNAISYYPNPVQDILTIKSTSKEFQLIGKIYDQLGREVKELGQIVHSVNSQVDMSDLSSGMYLLKITSHDNTMLKTFKINKK